MTCQTTSHKLDFQGRFLNLRIACNSEATWDGDCACLCLSKQSYSLIVLSAFISCSSILQPVQLYSFNWWISLINNNPAHQTALLSPGTLGGVCLHPDDIAHRFSSVLVHSWSSIDYPKRIFTPAFSADTFRLPDKTGTIRDMKLQATYNAWNLYAVKGQGNSAVSI